MSLIFKYYLFIYFFLEKIIRVDSKIVLFGDSAGGNMVVALQ